MINLNSQDIMNYYINQNHTQKETAEYFNCGVDTLINFCKKNNIIKDRYLTNKLESKIKLNKKI